MHTATTKQKILIAGGIVIVGIVISLITYYLSRHAPSYSTATVTTKVLTATISTTGAVVPDQTSVLSFSSQGKIQNVNVVVGDMVHKGDVLASLNTDTVQAQLDGAKADVLASQAQLDKMQQGTRPEQLSIYKQAYSDASSALLVAMNNAYLQTSDAINNKADTLFTNGNSVNPVINIRTQSQTEQLSTNQELVALNDAMNAWKKVLSPLTSTNISTTSLETARTTARDTLIQAQTFLSDLSTITGNLSIGNSGLSQTVINADMSVVNVAEQETTSATNSFTTANTAWGSARDNLTLQNAGAQSQDIATQEAALAKAQAEVEGYQSALSQSYIVAPFDGTITAVNVKIGEVFVPGISASEGINIINTNLYDVDTYVPENALSGLTVGNSASITFDAYGSDSVFPATVFLIDPAETVMNGVNSYKTTLHFDQPDARIRSGLTANVLITTATTTETLAVPTRAIIKKDTASFVLLRQKDASFKEQAVVTGINSADGYTQIISGLNLGDVIADFGAGNNY